MNGSNPKKTALITTGGTIGSSVVENHVVLRKTKTGGLFTQTLRGNKAIDIIPAINKSSEDIVPEDWLTILKAIEAANDDPVYGGIVVTHGTDTFAYTVAAILSYEPYLKKPVFVTGAFYAPDHPRSDAGINLRAALSAVTAEWLTTGVYVAFRSNQEDHCVRLSHASALLPMSFNDLYFNYICNASVGVYTQDNGLKLNDKSNSSLPCQVPALPSCKFPSRQAIRDAQTRIVSIKLYPGIDMETLKTMSRNRDIMIVELYHSGTGPSLNKGSLIEFLEETPNVKVLMGTFPGNHIRYPYTSSARLIDSGAFIYSNLQPHFLYTFSLLGLSLGLTADFIVQLLSPAEANHFDATVNPAGSRTMAL